MKNNPNNTTGILIALALSFLLWLLFFLGLGYLDDIRSTSNPQIGIEELQGGAGSTITESWVPITNKDINRLVNAIYWAEGGINAKKSYGILSIPCKTEQDCRQICFNTVKNNITRYESYGHKDYSNYIQFLASRYAPEGSDNDPDGLNYNWTTNVRWFLNNPKKV